ncbi:MAG TPA: aminopeptidase, partial [Devosia sp.]
MTKSPIDAAKLDKLAEVAIKVGLQLQEGQDLVMTGPSTALPLIRKIAEHAYRAGAGVVTPIISDEEVTLARYRHANDASFDRAPGWLYEGMAKAFAGNAARLAIAGDNPMMLAGQDPTKVARANRANSMAYKPALEKITGFDINWNIVAYPSPAWAKQVFPDDAEEVAIEKLANAIFAASRVDQADPVAAWKAHNAELKKRWTWLNEQRFASLAYTGPGTDVTIGLADGHQWKGGASESKNGITCNPNIPTEEVFTTPHRLRVEGRVRSTKPLSHNGTLIEDIEVRFEAGRIVSAKASKGEAVLNKVLDTDEGGRRLGEVALVPNSSPISKSGILFYNTLFDENAACHIALGQAYSTALEGAETLDAAGLAARGANSSL